MKNLVSEVIAKGLLYLVKILFLLLFLSGYSFGQTVIEINDSTKEFICNGSFIKILEDTSNSLTYEEVISNEYAKQFTICNSSYPYNENVNSTYWISFSVIDNSYSDKGFLLESYAPHTNDWQLFIADENGVQVKKSGIDFYFYNREYINKNLIFDLPLHKKKLTTFYVKVKSKNHSSFDFRIKPRRDFFSYSVNEYYLLGIFYGILLIMAVYNLLMFFAVKERVYIYYVIYVLCGMLTTLSDDGLGYQFLWVKYPQITTLVGSLFAPLLLLLSFTIYSREFLHLSQKYPKIDNAIILLNAINVGKYILALFYPIPSVFSQISYILPFAVIYYATWKSFLDGRQSSKWVISAFTFVLMSIILIRLRSNGTIPGNLFTVYSLNYGLVLEVLILSYAMADRFRKEKQSMEVMLRERNDAQYKALRQFRLNEELKNKVNDTLNEKNKVQERIIEQLRINEELKSKVNNELEDKVAERTRELNEKNLELERMNIKLKEMTDLANQMSLKLDVDNWNLQKDIKNSIRARLEGHEVSQEDFKNIFPDESACYRYLSEVKWDNSYSCKKCKHEGYNEETDGNGRTCQRCGYYESVTAHTIFHGIKFPLNKAFFLMYLKIHKKEKLTLDQLSEIVNLRRNTCWKFCQKIDLEIEEYLKKSKGRKIFSWEDIIRAEGK